MNTGVKILIVSVGVLGLGGLVWWISRKKSLPPSGQPIQPGQPGSPQLQVSGASSGAGFPLQNGSKNSYVKQLQTALGVTPVDGIFGADTLSALQSQFGISSVQNSDQLNQVVSQAAAIDDKIGLALNRVDVFQAGGVCVTVNQDTFCPQVNVDTAGNVTPTGLGITLSNGHYYDNTAYVLQGSTKMGQCLMQVVAADGTEGEYTIDPSAIFLVPPPPPQIAITPSYDPSTGLTQF